ncbi:hypothetical protein QR680_003395 [Steinernema hermaphroditum]|uniref:G-protein coupled receptors family 1 profile domain-containing protein n=1 Tax=Steinernema hermaphroditum TaxID=289476 RepID=A0AA39LJM9_9BILA|nr:hypothetical protein QR680_003395 [Steinernema hermaphroditum]
MISHGEHHNKAVQVLLQKSHAFNYRYDSARIEDVLRRLHETLAMNNTTVAIGELNDLTTMTSCVNYIDHDPDPTNLLPVMIFFAFLYFNIFVLSIVGNTVQNIFILNLAISDVIMCLLSLPFTPVTNIYKTWLFGQAICHLLPFAQAVSMFVSTISLSSIAIDRYILVVRPHCHPLNVRGATVVAIVLWVFSVIVSLPYGYYMHLESYPGYCGTYCTEHWPTHAVRRGYALVVLFAQFLIPFASMAVCYYIIFSRLRKRANVKLKKLNERVHLLEASTAVIETTTSASGIRQQKASSLIEDKQRSMVLAQQRRTTTILASMVLIFGLAWLPQNVVTLIIEYDENSTVFNRNGTNYTYIASMIAHSIAMITNVSNPVLYAWLNPSFKEIFMETFRKRSAKKQLHQTTIIKHKALSAADKHCEERAL